MWKFTIILGSPQYFLNVRKFPVSCHSHCTIKLKRVLFHLLCGMNACLEDSVIGSYRLLRIWYFILFVLTCPLTHLLHHSIILQTSTEYTGAGSTAINRANSLPSRDLDCSGQVQQ